MDLIKNKRKRKKIYQYRPVYSLNIAFNILIKNKNKYKKKKKKKKIYINF